MSIADTIPDGLSGREVGTRLRNMCLTWKEIRAAGIEYGLRNGWFWLGTHTGGQVIDMESGRYFVSPAEGEP